MAPALLRSCARVMSDPELAHDQAISLARRAGDRVAEARALAAAAAFYEATARPILAGELRSQMDVPLVVPAASASLDDIDVATMVEMAHAVASELVIDRLVARLMTLALEHAGASRAVLLLPEGDGLVIAAEETTSDARTTGLPESVLLFVSRTLESVIVDDTTVDGPYAGDPYVSPERVRSLLALPLIHASRFTGILYLENDLSSHVFTEARLGILRLFVSQAAIALENARLFGELRETEARRLEAQRLSNTGSFAWQLATNEMRWSEQVYKIFEYPCELPRSPEHVLERVHRDDLARVTAELARAATDGLDCEFRIVTPAATKHVQIVARPAAELAGAVIDVTERRRAEQKLRDAQHRFAITVASIADGVISTDDLGGITYINPVAEKLTGTRREDVLGTPADPLLREDLEPLRSELADGAGSVFVLRDPSRRRRADEARALAAANARMEMALRGSQVAVWDIDHRDRSIKPPPVHTINFWEAIGWPRSDQPSDATMYRPERFHPDDQITLYANMTAHLRGETPELHSELRLFGPDGTLRWCIYRARAIRDEHGQVLRLAGTTVNITERRALEDEMRVATAAAEAANRSKDEFLANVSHEIRTPMNAVLGMTELALDTQLTAEQRHWISTVKSAADNLLVIIDELLDFSKTAANKVQLFVADFSLHRELEDTLRGMALAAQRKGLALILDIADDVPEPLRGDPTRLRQIVTNLVGNAIKFTSAGEIEVTVRRAHSEHEIALAFAVRDTGIGIPEDKQATIFEPFTQADVSTTRQFGGTGLGLAISSRLASLMNGRITVASKHGRGSTFTLTACFAAGQGPATMPLPAMPADARVLVADANETERALVARWLRSAGMRVTTAAGGVAAIDVLWNGVMSNDPFQIALVDFALPQSARIRERPAFAACRVIEMREKPLVKRELFELIAPRATPRVLRILVAEDSEFNADLIRELLRKRGCDPVIVDNGHAVLARLAEEAFDLLLLDLHMPGLDGFQVVERLRAREQELGGHLPVAALTARARAEDRDRCLAAGMDEFLGKPIRSAALWDMIARLVR